MKKIIFISVAFAFAFLSCASGPRTTKDGRAVVGGMPDFIKTAVKKAPSDVLLGIGSARIGAAGIGQARTIATARARAEISRQMNTIVRDMLRDYTESSEISPKDAVSYQETINVQLSKSDLTGSSVIEQDRDGDNNWWVVVTMGKKSVAQEINQAQASARLAIPKSNSIDAEARMDKAFEKTANEPIRYSDN